MIASAVCKEGRSDCKNDNGNLGCSHHEIEEFKNFRGVRNAGSRVTDPGLQATGTR